MIRCAHCGYENPPGHIFCIGCRQKLDLSRIDTRELNRPAGRSRSVFKTFWQALLFIVLAGLVLALWPASPAYQPGSAADYQEARRKFALMNAATNPTAQVILEPELNAGLARGMKISSKGEEANFWQRCQHAAGVTLKPYEVVLQVVCLPEPVEFFGYKLTLKFSFELAVLPEVKDGNLVFTVRRGAFGHLPLFGPAARLLVTPTAEVFSELRAGCPWLARVSTVQLESGRITVGLRR